MNRAERRAWFKKNHNKLKIESWEAFNGQFKKKKPYVNPNPKQFKYNPKKHHV